MSLKKEYTVTEIKASLDGSPYVFISLKNPDEVGSPQRPVSSSSVATFGSMDDMFKNLGDVISKQIMGGFSTVIKLSLNEYEKLDIKVGDRLSIAIEKAPIRVL
jgi:hypothetical protein